MKTAVRLIGLRLCTNLPGFSYGEIMEEIVVTTQERKHNVQEVGIAINALTGDQMDQLGYTNSQQVTAMAADVSTVQPNGKSNYSNAICGAENSDYTANVLTLTYNI